MPAFIKRTPEDPGDVVEPGDGLHLASSPTRIRVESQAYGEGQEVEITDRQALIAAAKLIHSVYAMRHGARPPEHMAWAQVSQLLGEGWREMCASGWPVQA